MHRWLRQPAYLAAAGLLLVAAATAVLLALLLEEESSPASTTERPIVYVVVLDGLDGDTVDAGRLPFVASLLRGEDGASSTYYRESRALMTAETNPNHVAMMTGAYIDRSGIPANEFAIYGRVRPGTCRMIGPVTESRPPAAVDGEHPSCVSAETVFQAIRRQGNPDGLRSAGIFGKPKLGAIFSSRGAGGDLDADEVSVVEGDGDTSIDAAVMDRILASPSRPGITFVNLPGVDLTGHGNGRGARYNAAATEADRQIRRLVTRLKERGDWNSTVLILLSDHSMATATHGVNLRRAFAAARVPPSRYVEAPNGSASMIYLANRRSPGRFALLARMRRAALRTGAVREALYRLPNPRDGDARHTLDRVHPGWHASGARTGDLYLTTRAAGAFSATAPAIVVPAVGRLRGFHGGAHTLDNFFAVIGGGRFVRQQTISGARVPYYDDTLRNPRAAENVDVAPTVMRLLGLRPPRQSRGRFLSEAFDLAHLPGRGRPGG